MRSVTTIWQFGVALLLALCVASLVAGLEAL